MKCTIPYTLMGILSVLFLLGFATLRSSRARLSGIQIATDTTAGTRFFNRAEIEGILRSHAVQVQKPLQALNLGKIEREVGDLPYVAEAQTYISVGGQLKVVVRQKTALARIHNAKGDYYLTDTGGQMPLSPDYAADVILVQGEFTASDLQDLKALVKALQQRSFLSQFIIGIQLRGKDYVLFTRSGAHRIIFGRAQRIDEKLNKLITFYKKVLNPRGWATYRLVNLKYRDQVICTKS
ncbi:MAG: hypothetical protein V6Z82_02140 [Flavobacteriales bacterium]